MDIIVVPVNDPPVAVASVISLRVPEARTTRRTTNRLATSQYSMRNYPKDLSKIRLHGSDVDVGDEIVGVQIVSVPRRGYLSLVVTSFRHDMLLHGTRLSENVIVSNIDPVYVEYTFDRSMDNNNQVLVQNNDVKDYFTFRVRDRQGWWSIEERVEIQVTSSLIAHAEPMVRMNEDSLQLLHWHGSDVSIRNRHHIQFYIEKVPSVEIGRLLHPRSNVTISQPGMILLDPTISVNDLEIYFQSSQNFCHTDNNTTASQYDNEIRFRIVSIVDMNNDSTTSTNGTFVDSASDPFTQQIWIDCTLDVLELTFPENVHHQIMASSLQRTTTDPCNALQWIKPTKTVDVTSCQSVAFMTTGINVTSVDGKAAMVTVSLTTKIGLITLNPQYWNRSIPLLGRPTLSAGTIAFRAYPDDVTSILSSLHYQSFVVGNDTVDINLQYGNCTFDEQQQHATMSSNLSFRAATCQILHRSIPISVIPDKYYNQRNGQRYAKFPWQLIFCLFGYSALYLVVVYLESWYHRGKMNHDHHEGSGNQSGTVPESQERYIQHEDDNGMIYYEDSVTGLTHWSIPLPEECSVRGRDII